VPGRTPPSIADENRRPGTRTWRLPGGRSHGRLDAYVSDQDVQPGQAERIYVSAPGAHLVTVRIYRIGWYGGRGGRLVLASGPLPVRRQPRCHHATATGLTECRWHPTLSLTIPPALPSGVYVVGLASDRGARRDTLFVVEAARPAPVLAHISTASYEAYNYWGGDSLYPGGRPVGVTGTTQGVEVSYDRPYDSITGAGQFFNRDVAVVRFLERYGYRVSYVTNTGLDRRPEQALGARVLLDVGHSEYWSQAEEGALERARDRGVNLLFLSSDTLAWRVRFAPATRASSEGADGAPHHRIISYKEHVSRDPVRSLPSGAFPHNGAPLTGSAYIGCITQRLSRPGRAIYRYYDWSPAPGLRPAWLFAGTGVTEATRIHGILGYELDQRVPASPAGVQVVGGGAAPCMGLGPRLGQSTLYQAPSGALVFATGTLGWDLGLDPVPDASPDAPRRPDARVVAMTRNLLARMLGKRSP
jgi:hypothetical protein